MAGDPGEEQQTRVVGDERPAGLLRIAFDFAGDVDVCKRGVGCLRRKREIVSRLLCASFGDVLVLGGEGGCWVARGIERYGQDDAGMWYVHCM